MKRKIRKDLQPILTELKNELVGLFGSQLELVYLYGSQARGDARPDSDIDVLIVLREPFDYLEMIQATSEVVGNLSLKYDVVFSRAFSTQAQFLGQTSPWLATVLKEGIAV